MGFVSLPVILSANVSSDLKDLARLLADWAASAPGVTLYLFGSRVRGDHRPDSDIDVCIQWSNRLDDNDVRWWTINNEEDFAAIKPKLPGPLKILVPEDQPWTKRVIGAESVYDDRNVRCVWCRRKIECIECPAIKAALAPRQSSGISRTSWKCQCRRMA